MRRSLVLDAARATFFERGIEGASVREIAKRAGYTPGAIYSYYSSKEEMYGALLDESLERLNAQVDAAHAAPVKTAASIASRREAALHELRARAGAFFAFYHDQPRDLDLGSESRRSVSARSVSECWSSPRSALRRRASSGGEFQRNSARRVASAGSSSRPGFSSRKTNPGEARIAV